MFCFVLWFCFYSCDEIIFSFYRYVYTVKVFGIGSSNVYCIVFSGERPDYFIVSTFPVLLIVLSCFCWRFVLILQERNFPAKFKCFLDTMGKTTLSLEAAASVSATAAEAAEASAKLESTLWIKGLLSSLAIYTAVFLRESNTENYLNNGSAHSRNSSSCGGSSVRSNTLKKHKHLRYSIDVVNNTIVHSGRRITTFILCFGFKAYLYMVANKYANKRTSMY